MKTKLLFTFIMLLMSITIFSQNLIGEKTGTPTPPSFTYQRPQNCALNTSFLMMDMKQNKDVNYLKERYNVTEVNSELFVGAFIKVDTYFDKSSVEKLGIELNTKAGQRFTARIPLGSLEDLFQVSGILNVEIGEKVFQTLDNARSLTNVNHVHNGTGILSQSYSGNGVIVGVIDTGFDYTHPTFRNLNTNQTRIKRVWEQTTTGTPPTEFSFGNEITSATNIINSGTDIDTNTGDKNHGTHVTGIAAGSGGIANSVYKGMAYDSDIVLVSTDMTSEHILDGINYIFNYANSVSKPAVINMSIGGHYGPHDGTSEFDSMCNNIVGPGKILVGSAGNQGGDKIHINKTLSTGNSLFSFISFPNSQVNYPKGSTLIDIWGEVGNKFEIAVNIFNVLTNQIESYTPYIDTQTNTLIYQGTIYDNDTTSAHDPCVVAISTENSNTNNGKPHAIVVINNSQQDDVLRYVLLEVRSSNGLVNAWDCGKEAAVFTDLSALGSSAATNGNTDMTVAEIGGTGNSIISVGAYNSKQVYTPFSSTLSPVIDFPGFIGDIASFSSKGPTADGRVKPDITAPGNVIVSSVNHFDTTYNATNASTVSGLNNSTTNWWFATMQGTSMSAPVVTGIIALWLQAKPNLTVAQIKTILQNTSITAGLGSLPNNNWGSGKIDAMYGMFLIEQALNTGTFKNNIKLFPNPTTSKVFFDNSISNFKEVSIYNYLGQEVAKTSFASSTNNQAIDMSNLATGVYVLKFSNAETSKSVKVIKQ